MPIALEFEYHKPRTLKEALGLRAKIKGSSVLAGGTDLVNWLKEDLVKPAALIDIKAIKELKHLEVSKDSLFIGSNVTFEELIESKVIREKYPLIFEMSKTVASVAVRNRATIAGNICSAVPSCDAGAVLMVYGDVGVIAVSSTLGPSGSPAGTRSSRPGSPAQTPPQKLCEAGVEGASAGERKIAIKDWFAGPKKTSLKSDEIVKGVLISNVDKKHGSAYTKLGRYKGEDLAQASVAAYVSSDGLWRIACGAVAPTPVRTPKTEAILKGKANDPKAIEAAKKQIVEEIAPISDIRASKEYRSHMIAVMLERAVAAASSRLAGKGPEYGTSFL
ncbi:MAG: xanthine dehydrogenase family protein subunit M [Elusimicrobia bacterium]|nr:xanthine dehydrogenase family protein subunit M [Elusimicrobiota bacterium]